MAEWVWAAAIGGVGLLALVAAAIALIGDRPRGRRRCPKCWYSMDGLDSVRCPECGREAKNAKTLLKTRRRWRFGVVALVLVIVGSAGVVYRVSDSDTWLHATPTWLLLRLFEDPDYKTARANQAPAPVMLQGQAVQWVPPPPPATTGQESAWDRLATRLSAELARRHLEGELSIEETRVILHRSMPELREATRDGVIWARDKWLAGVPYRAVDLITNEVAMGPWATHFGVELRIEADGEDVTLEVLKPGYESWGYELSGDTTLTARLVAVDLHVTGRDVWSRTFPLPIEVKDNIADVLEPMTPDDVAGLDESLRLSYKPIRGYVVAVDLDGEFGPVLSQCEFGALNDRTELRYQRCFRSWPFINVAHPTFKADGSEGQAVLHVREFPLRLLLDPECTRCLPEGGLVIPFDDLLRGETEEQS